MDYERASEVIQNRLAHGIGACYCRHKMQHMGKSCNAPMDICMTFSGTAQSLIKHGIRAPGWRERRHGSFGQGSGAQPRAVRRKRAK